MSKIHPDLLKVSTMSSKPINCFVYSNNFVGLENRLKQSNIEYIGYPFMDCFFARLNSMQILELSKLNETQYITKSVQVFTLIDKAKQFMHTDKILPKFTPPTIAYIDTGIAPHLDFLLPKNRIIHFKDLINGRTLPYDDNGHGSFVSGICAGSGVCSGKVFSGIVPDSNIVMVKALDKNGETSSNKIIEAMQYIYSVRKKYGIKVVCMSFGADYTGKNDPLQKGALALWNSGLVVVAAAGNSGPKGMSIKSPGTSSRIITVGGLDDGRIDNEIKIADFSSRGPVDSRFKPDLVAPSIDITSTNADFKHGLYTKMSGASVATPMIAGICALMLANSPKLSPDKVKYNLINMCKPLTHNKNEEGYGYLQF